MNLKLARNRNGFTLVEILIVLVIIAILITIAVPLFRDVTDSARHSVWKYNGSYVVKVIALSIWEYKGEDRYTPPAGGDFNYSDEGLNNYLEKELEYYQADSNKDSIKNPTSRSMKILHEDSPVSGSVASGRDPAVFITGNSAYSYTGSGSVENLSGTIVAYFNQNDPYNIQLYYIDNKGVKSSKLADFR